VQYELTKQNQRRDLTDHGTDIDDYKLVNLTEEHSMVKMWQGHWGMERWHHATADGPRSPYYRGTGVTKKEPGFTYILRKPWEFHLDYRKNSQKKELELLAP